MAEVSMLAALFAMTAAAELWEQQRLPLEPGRCELRTGIGVDYSPAAGRVDLAPPVDFRIGLGRNVTLRGPLAAELQFLDAAGARPGLVVRGGLQGIGFSSVFGLALFPTAGVEAFWRGRDLLVLLGAQGHSQLWLAGTTLPFAFLLSVRAGLLHRVTERVSLGTTVSLEHVIRPEGLPPVLAIEVTARVHLAGSWYLELVARGTERPEPEYRRLAATLFAVWMPRAWEPETD